MFRKHPAPIYERVTLELPDTDFLDIDVLKGSNPRLAILCHGLEGSSQSHYMRGTASLLHDNEWDVIAMNFRGCSGRINRKKRMYHSGATDDLDFLIQLYMNIYDEIALIGFSLGGNLVLKYSGEQSSEIDPVIKSVVAISVPTDLAAGALHIGQRQNIIYERRFLKSLKHKIRSKHQQFPDEIDLVPINRINKLYDFDDRYTSVLHGFKNAEDYYTQSSSAQFIPSITLPGLIVNAMDDPFLPKECYPIDACEQNKNIELIMPRFGGHVGFVIPGSMYYWNEFKTLEFINKHSSTRNSRKPVQTKIK